VRDDGRIKVLGIGGKAAKEGDDRADQLAWGVMAHELLAGEAPDAVVAAIQRAHSTSPTDRFTSMGELIEALEPFAAPALPPASVPRPRRAWDNGSAARDRAPAGRLRLYALLGTAACALGVTVFFRMRTEANHDAIPTVTMSSAIAMTALSLLDQPASSDVPAAAAAYVAGLQAEHEGNDEAAESSFLEAAAADPAMATAHLRYAIAAVTQHPAEAHTHFLGATAARSTLTEHDAALLDALAPLFDKEPPDWAEAERNLQLESSRRPNDAELRYELARVRLAQSKLPEAISAARGALTLDPRFTAARLLATRALERQSDSSGATLP
jgi:tetratricopeptide (TPR) repeat protein